MSPKRVLVVDDTREIGRMIQAALETLGPGLTTTVLPTAEEALQEIDRQPFDLMVIDVRLPGISGLELTRKLRSRRHAAKVIQISGINDPRLREMATQLGADMFFAKPLIMNEFLAAVEKLIAPGKTSPRLGGAPGKSRPRSGVDQALAALRQRIAASAAIIFDQEGKVISAVGDLPAAAARADFYQVISASLSAAEKAGRMLHQPDLENVIVIRGAEYDLAAAPLSNGNVVLVLAQRGASAVRLAVAMDELLGGQANLALLVPQAGAGTSRPTGKLRQEAAGTGTPPPEEDKQVSEQDLDAELASLFSKHNLQVATQADVDAFWTNAADLKAGSTSADQGEISFEEAQKRGLGPKEGV